MGVGLISDFIFQISCFTFQSALVPAPDRHPLWGSRVFAAELGSPSTHNEYIDGRCLYLVTRDLRFFLRGFLARKDVERSSEVSTGPLGTRQMPPYEAPLSDS